MHNPFIFILDLDGTIIGDCSYQVIINTFEDVLKQNKLKSVVKNTLLGHYHQDSKLIRPYFKYFIEGILQYNCNSQFYIYTASEKSWATKEIAAIEKANGIKFNRPIFTRDDCIIDSFGMYKKSVAKILPRILKNNKSDRINKNNIVVIDNNKVFIDYLSNVIICPSYEHIHFYDLWERIKPEHTLNENVMRYLSSLVSSNKICKWGPTETDSNEMEYKCKWFYKKYKKINRLNKKYSNDMFWKRLTDSIINQRVTWFDKDTVKTIARLSCNKCDTSA